MTVEEPKKQNKRKAKRQIQDEEPDQPDEVAPKKRVSFQFDDPVHEVPKESAPIPPDWEQYTPGNEKPKKKIFRRKAASPKIPRVPKKVKKVLTDVEANDYLQCWDYELNSEQTEPLANAMRKANQDSNFSILKRLNKKMVKGTGEGDSY
jgi:hypothetical protein